MPAQRELPEHARGLHPDPGLVEPEHVRLRSPAGAQSPVHPGWGSTVTGVRAERVERVFLAMRTVAWNVVRYTLANGAVVLSSHASRTSDGSTYSARRREIQ